MMLMSSCSTTLGINNFCDRYPTIENARPSIQDTIETKRFSLTYIKLREKDCAK